MRVSSLTILLLVSALVSGCRDRERVHTEGGSTGRLVSIEPTPARGRVGEPLQLLVTVYDLDGVRRTGERVTIESSRSDDVFSVREGVTDEAGTIVTTLTASVEGRRVIAAHVGAAKGEIALAVDRVDEPSTCTGGLLLGGYPPVEPIPDRATPYLMATGDFDGDGSCEVGFLGDGWSTDRSTTLTIRGGTDWPDANDLMGPGWSPSAVATGDFDGDGRLDLAVVGTTIGWQAFRVAWFSVGADLVWQRMAELDLPGKVRQLVAVDIDGDGRSDLVAESDQQTLRAILLTADGPVLGDAVSVPSDGSRTWAWAAGDFDGDGKADIAIARAGWISILGGIGDGTFKPARPLDSEVSPAFNELVAADLDGDGLDDLATFETTDTWVTFLTIYQGRTDGSFERVRVSDRVSGSLSPGDVDGDGVSDLVVRAGSWDGTELFVVRGNREGRFAGPERLMGLPLPTFQMSICKGASGPEIAVRGGTEWVRFPLVAPAPDIPSTEFDWSGGVVGNSAEDGSVEIVTVDSEGGGRRFAIDASGTTQAVGEFQIHRQIPSSTVRAVGRVGEEPVGSVVEVGRRGDDAAIIVHSLSTGTFRQVATSADVVRAVSIIDVDGDGLNDLVYGTTDETIALFADEAGTLRPERVADVGAWAIAAGDLDGDGAVELILGSWQEIVVVPYGGSFGPPEPLPLPRFAVFRPLLVGDFDGDGMDDIATGGNDASIISVYLQSAGGEFGPALEFGVGGENYTGAFGRLAGGSERGFVFLASGPVTRVVPLSCRER